MEEGVLLAGLPVETKSGLEIHPLTLKEIMKFGMGLYNYCVSFLVLNEDVLRKVLGTNEEDLEELIKNKYHVLANILQSNEEIKEMIIKFLKLVTKKDCVFSQYGFLFMNKVERDEYLSLLKSIKIEESQLFDLLKSDETREDILKALSQLANKEYIYLDGYLYTDIQHLDEENYLEMINILELQSCFKTIDEININDEDDPEIIAFLKRKDMLNKKISDYTNKDNDTNLEDLISSLSVAGIGLNILNVWDMTLYQFYNQLKRYGSKVNYDMSIKSMLAGATDVKLDNWMGKIKSE